MFCFLLAAKASKRNRLVGQRPILAVRYLAGTFGPLDGACELLLQDQRQRAIRKEGPTLRIIGAECDRPLEPLDRFIVPAQISKRVSRKIIALVLTGSHAEPTSTAAGAEIFLVL